MSPQRKFKTVLGSSVSLWLQRVMNQTRETSLWCVIQDGLFQDCYGEPKINLSGSSFLIAVVKLPTVMGQLSNCKAQQTSMAIGNPLNRGSQTSAPPTFQASELSVAGDCVLQTVQQNPPPILTRRQWYTHLFPTTSVEIIKGFPEMGCPRQRTSILRKWEQELQVRSASITPPQPTGKTMRRSQLKQYLDYTFTLCSYQNLQSYSL